jgi:Rieske 2Fe-2S family protein
VVVTPDEVAATRRPTAQAATLPGRVFHDPAVLELERDAWFMRDWLCVGRAEQAAVPGDYFLFTFGVESVIIVRGRDGALRAFRNVCRHRGARLVEEPSGNVVRFQCPYHAWIYDLQGQLRPPRYTRALEDFQCAAFGLHPVRLATSHGFVFVSFAAEGEPLDAVLGTLPETFARYPLSELRQAVQLEYAVNANWKALLENYSECYHCPGVHPLLNHLTPYNLGGYLSGEGHWAGSWMELVGEHETLSMDGKAHGRPPLPGTRPEDLNRVYYAWIWPNLLFSLHPDYLMTHQVWPLDAEHSEVICKLYFHPDTMALPDFDPSGPAEFWDLTNRQDWHVCELQQAGTRSAAYTPGRYSSIEAMVHSFDALVADRYADDGVRTEVIRGAKEAWSIRPGSDSGRTGRTPAVTSGGSIHEE